MRLNQTLTSNDLISLNCDIYGNSLITEEAHIGMMNCFISKRLPGHSK